MRTRTLPTIRLSFGWRNVRSIYFSTWGYLFSYGGACFLLSLFTRTCEFQSTKKFELAFRAEMIEGSAQRLELARI